jgi:4-hydroxybenzoate polyprenyltransferase
MPVISDNATFVVNIDEPVEAASPSNVPGNAQVQLRPLVVSLDALLKSDLLVESANMLVTQRSGLPRLLAWACAGAPELRSRLAQCVAPEPEWLPYNLELVGWLREEQACGRRLVLAAACQRPMADAIARHLALFDEVLVHEPGTPGGAGEEVLVRRYGPFGFDYVGSAAKDGPCFNAAARAHLVGAPVRLADRLRAQGKLGRSLGSGKPPGVVALAKAMRPHQWAKNLLVFVALLASHRYGDMPTVMHTVLAFLAFGLVASSVYLLNDLLDLPNDRRHARKRRRPFAAGDLGLGTGWLAWPVLLAAGLTLGVLVLPVAFGACLAMYGAITLAYSLRLKQEPIVDVMTLALLYTLRVVAGAAAAQVPLSFWLLSFALFAFFSLAMIKRYSELVAASSAGVAGLVRGRGYRPQDVGILAGFGSSSAFLSVLVFALYIQDSHTSTLYARPQLIWLACPLLLFWMSRAWFLSHRGQMHDDPVVFALTDRVSWAVALLFGAVFLLAR